MNSDKKKSFESLSSELLETGLNSQNVEGLDTVTTKSIQDSDFPSSVDDELKERELELINIRVRWSRAFLLSIIISIIVVSINVLVFWLLLKYADRYVDLPLLLLIECGLLLIFGGCIGLFRQSFTINLIKVRLLKGEKITGVDTKIALGSAFTYIFAGFFVGAASLISWLVLRQILPWILS